MARRTKPTIEDEVIDKLLEGCEHSAALLGNDGLIGELKKRLAERMLSAEMDVHLDDEERQFSRYGENNGNSILDRRGYVHRLESAAATLGKVIAGTGHRDNQSAGKQSWRLTLRSGTDKGVGYQNISRRFTLSAQFWCTGQCTTAPLRQGKNQARLTDKTESTAVFRFGLGPSNAQMAKP